jgi:hypothetical protein
VYDIRRIAIEIAVYDLDLIFCVDLVGPLPCKDFFGVEFTSIYKVSGSFEIIKTVYLLFIVSRNVYQSTLLARNP